MAAELKARLTLNNTQFLRGLRGSLTAGKRFGSELASRGFAAAKVGLMGVAAAAVISGGALAVGVKSAYDLGGSLSDLSTRTGITAGRLIVMQRAFMDNGLAADETGNAVNRMQRFLVDVADGTLEARRTMDAMNLTLDDFAGLTPDRQFELVSTAINGIEDASLRADSAMTIFGRSGGKLLTLFADRGAMSTAGRVLGRQAEILDKRANDFDAISDKLGRAGVKLQGFFVGVAATLAGTIGPLLDKFEGLDFATIGERFGSSLISAADALLGAFRDPEKALGALKDYAGGAMAEAGNRLQQSFGTAITFFRDAFSGGIQGIGHLLLGTLLDVFGEATAEFQARTQATLSLLDPKNAGDAIRMRQIDDRLGIARAALQSNAESGNSEAVRLQMQEINRLAAEAAGISDRMSGGSVEERKAAILASGGPRINMGAEGALTAAQLKASGASMLSSSLAAARVAPYSDIFGAGDAFARAEGTRTALAASGAQVRAAALAAPATAQQSAGPRNRYEDQLYSIYGRAKAQQIISSQASAPQPASPRAAEKSLSLQEKMAQALNDLVRINQEAFGT